MTNLFNAQDEPYHINKLCKYCINECKQSRVVTIITCPNYKKISEISKIKEETA